MQELKECLTIRRKIEKIDDKILTLKEKSLSPKNQIITGMPRGGGFNGGNLDDYLIKVEQMKAEKNTLQKSLDKLWEQRQQELSQADIDTTNILMLKRRFYFGYSWRKCAARMAMDYPSKKWNENKCFRVYRNVLYKLNKKYL